MTDEEKARVSLAWALSETVVKVPKPLENVAMWRWRAGGAQLTVDDHPDTWRFHIAMERRGVRRTRIAVLVVEDDAGCGKVTWEAPIPDHVIGVVV